MQVKESLKDIIPYSAGKSFPGKIKLSSNENPLGPSPKAIEAIENILKGLHRYPDGSSMDLRKAIAEHLDVEPEWLVIGNGSDEILALACGALINTGDCGIVSENTFSEYQFSIKLFGGKPRTVPLENGTYDLKAMISAIDEKCKILFVCNPNNPTGTYRTHSELEDFLSEVPENILVILDEAYQDYVDAADYPRALELVKKYPNLLVTRTFSKIFGLAGLRIGYALAQPEVINGLMHAKQAFNVNLLSQAAGIAAIKDKSFHDASRAMTLAGKNYLYRELDALGLAYYPSQSNFLCIKMGKPADEVYQSILDRGIIIRSLSSFGMKDSIRYTVSNEEDNRKFVTILKELKEKGLC